MSRSHSRISLLSFALAFFLLLNAPAAGQIFEEIYIVDSPTAGILPHGGYLFQGSVGPRSSLLFGVKIGFHDRLLLGVSFGLQDFIGRGDISVNDKPGFEFRIRIIEEQVVGPALAIGIDTQGEDSYIESSERYERKSKGFYAALSKNYELLRDFSIHGGLNYSLETKDEKGINFFGGVSMEVVAGLSILLDYNAAIDDDDPDVRIRLADNPDVLSRPTRGRGYLDTGVCFNY
ncbi:MAG: hypothetical protein KAX38_05970, partial [Candidatus Krumholzibacteria bacterium]|nr:hypothetical protein [Candidatus Krumholzibacteria bacterium]